jgi:hypothetical protein
MMFYDPSTGEEKCCRYTGINKSLDDTFIKSAVHGRRTCIESQRNCLFVPGTVVHCLRIGLMRPHQQNTQKKNTLQKWFHNLKE